MYLLLVFWICFVQLDVFEEGNKIVYDIILMALYTFEGILYFFLASSNDADPSAMMYTHNVCIL